MSTPNTAPTLSEAAFPIGQSPNARRIAVKKTLFGATVLALAVLVLGYSIRVVFFQHSVVATGYLQPESVTQLNFGTSGRVAEIYVLPGDVVHAGQVLGKQDVSALQAQLTADEATLAADQAAITYEQNPLRPPEILALRLAVSAADAQLQAAQIKAADTTKLDSALLTTLANNVQAVRNTLASDQQQVGLVAAECNTISGASAPATSVPASAASVSDAVPGVGAALAAAVETATTPPTTTTIDPYRRTTTTTTIPPVPLLPPTAAITVPPPTTTTISPAAQASLIGSCGQLVHQIAQDQAALTETSGAYDQAVLNQQLDQDTLWSAVSVAQSELGLASAKQSVGLLPATPATLALARAAVAKDNATSSADRKALDDGVIVAPSDGIVASVGGVVGDIVGPDGVREFGSPQPLPQRVQSGIQLFPQPPQQQSQQQSQFSSLLTLDSLTAKVVAQVSETDLKSVSRNSRAHITFPALRDTSVTAVVERIEPRAVNVGGKVYLLVDLVFDAPSPSPQTVEAASATDDLRKLNLPVSTLVVGLTANVRF